MTTETVDSIFKWFFIVCGVVLIFLAVAYYFAGRRLKYYQDLAVEYGYAYRDMRGNFHWKE